MAHTQRYLKLNRAFHKIPRTDLLTASRLDFALSLLPMLGKQAVARMLASYDVPLGVVVRVLASQRRRKIAE